MSFFEAAGDWWSDVTTTVFDGASNVLDIKLDQEIESAYGGGQADNSFSNSDGGWDFWGAETPGNQSTGESDVNTVSSVSSSSKVDWAKWGVIVSAVGVGAMLLLRK